MAAERQICVGIVTGVHGLRGEVVIRSYTADPLDIDAYGPLSDQDGEGNYVLSQVRPAKKGVIARIQGVTTREAAEALKGAELFVSRARLPQPDEDEFYHTDLIGLAALSADGERLGEVVGVHDYGAGDLLEIKPGEGGKSALYPFTREVVPALDFAAGALTLVPPEEIEARPDEQTGKTEAD